MNGFSSGENEYVLFNFLPRDTSGGPILIVTIDTPFEAELYSELMLFWKSYIKIKITDQAEKKGVETEFTVKDVAHKDFKEGPRIRIILYRPYELDVTKKIINLYKDSIKFEFEVMQKELGLEDEE